MCRASRHAPPRSPCSAPRTAETQVSASRHKQRVATAEKREREREGILHEASASRAWAGSAAVIVWDGQEPMQHCSTNTNLSASSARPLAASCSCPSCPFVPFLAFPLPAAEERFFQKLEAEVDKCGKFTARLVAELRERLKQLQGSVRAVPRDDESQRAALLEVRWAALGRAAVMWHAMLQCRAEQCCTWFQAGWRMSGLCWYERSRALVLVVFQSDALGACSATLQRPLCPQPGLLAPALLAKLRA